MPPQSAQESRAPKEIKLKELGCRAGWRLWFYYFKSACKRQLLWDYVKAKLEGTAAGNLNAAQKETLRVLDEGVVNSLARTAGAMAEAREKEGLIPILKFSKSEFGDQEDDDEDMILQEFRDDTWDGVMCLDEWTSFQLGRLNRCKNLVTPGHSANVQLKMSLCKQVPLRVPALQNIATQAQADSGKTWEQTLKEFKAFLKRTNSNKGEKQAAVFHLDAASGGNGNNQNQTQNQDQNDPMVQLMQQNNQILQQNGDILAFFAGKGKGKGKGKWNKNKPTGRGPQCRICKKKFGDESGFGHIASNCWHNANNKGGGKNNNT